MTKRALGLRQIGFVGFVWRSRVTNPIFGFARHGVKQGASGFFATHRFNHQSNSQRETSDKRVALAEVNKVHKIVVTIIYSNKSIWEKRIKLLSPYQVNSKVMANAKANAIFLHCLPSFHDLNTTVAKDIYEKYGLKEMEVTNEVFTSKQSKVFDEAENRLHTIKAVMYATLK